MSNRWPGGLIRKTPVTPTGPLATGAAPGMWSLADAAYWTKQGLWPNASLIPDASFPYVSYLMSTTATNAQQNNTFLDSSTNNFTVTRNGNTTQGSFNPYGSLWSNYFDGTGDNLTIPSNAAFGFGTGDFTIEFWAYIPTWTSDAQLIGCHTAFAGFDWLIQQYTSGQFRWLDASLTLQSGTVPTTNQWNHYAVTRSGTTLRIFLNGTQTASGTSTANIPATRALGIMGDTGASATQIGYMSNVRVVKGTAVYTAAFTPPTAPLTAISGTSLLTCQSNRFRDNSTNAFTITVNGDTRVTNFSPFSPTYPGYSPSAGISSVYFDGATDWLNLGGQSAFAYGTGAFTIECWFYAFGLGQMIIDGRPAFTNGNYVLVAVGGGGTLEYYSNNVGQVLGNTQIPLRAWNHFAIARSGTTTKMFLNGVQNASFTDNTNYEAATDRPIIGTNGYRTDLSHFNGYMANFRIVKGTAVYTANFTPPTSPVTAISGTSLLLNATNAGIFDAATINNMETVGNAQVSTAVSKFGGSSVYFDGTGDYLAIPTGPQLYFGTSDFTVEAWIYPTGGTGNRAIFSGNGTNGMAFYINTSGKIAVAKSGVVEVIASTTTISTSTFTYVAATRSGNTFRIFVNGTLEATVTSSQDFTSFSDNRVGYESGSSYYQGYIDDLRVTKGVARYTANFTPPTQAFPPY